MGGQGRDGRLGHGDQEHQLLPKKVEALAGQRVIAVSAGGEHSLALTADGSVWSWGFGVEGQLGHGDMQNQLAGEKPGLTGVERADGFLPPAQEASLCSPRPPARLAQSLAAAVFCEGRLCAGHWSRGPD